MNELLEKIEDIIRNFSKYFKKDKDKDKPSTNQPDSDKDEGDGEEEQEPVNKDRDNLDFKNTKFNEGDPGPYFGIKRSWIKGIAIGAVAVFIMAFFFAYSRRGTEKKPQRQQELVLADEHTVSNSMSKGDTAANEALLRQHAAEGNGNNKNHDKDKETARREELERQRRQQQQAAQQQAQQQQLPQIPVTPQRNYNQYPYNAAYGNIPVVQQIPQTVQQQTQQKEDDEPDNKWSSAITFGSYGGGSASSSDGNANASSNTDNIGASSNAGTYTPLTENTIQAGTIIPAVLMSGINSDASGGMIMAQVQADVYDTLTGQTLLIPIGSRFLGTASTNNVENGRVSIQWQTVILPNGGSYQLGENMFAIDGAGYAGLKGDVDRHSARTIGAGVFSTVLAALGSAAAGNTTASDTYSAGQIAAQGALSNLLDTASSMFEQTMNQKATVTVDPGYQFNIFVGADVTFEQPN